MLEALKAQTLSREHWELLLIDNASKEPLAGKWDLSWHPRARHLREDELGLTPARLRGIREAGADLLVFVDDDNVLAPDYLQTAQNIAAANANLGVWAGNTTAEFEITPPEWSRRFWPNLALRSVEKSYWANITTNLSLLPFGAGMCVRKNVGQAHAARLADDLHRRELDRKGQSLTSAGDTDLGLTACALGLGYGVFAELRMIHLIPKDRLTENYLLRLEEGIAFSSTLLQVKHNGATMSPPSSPLRQKLGALRRRLTMKRLDRLALEARIRGWNKVREVIAGQK